MKVQIPTSLWYWISLALLVVALLFTPTGYGFAQTSTTPTPSESPLETPTAEPTMTPTPGSTAATPAATAVPTGEILGNHTVKSGETLYCIGRAYGIDPYAIATQNNILNPNKILVGQVLAIPNEPRALPSGQVCPRQFGGTTTLPTCRWNHTVASGENLYRIALKYEVSMYSIADANDILNLNLIFVGQELCIP
ncbi:MAG: LysM peptidoglycan-binding domain-containing protein [Chloroflexi bacterium]|nr:LysM peptidoglycan-binding domain-containing protein [Chloroflexota bacterium]